MTPSLSFCLILLMKQLALLIFHREPAGNVRLKYSHMDLSDVGWKIKCKFMFTLIQKVS